MHKRSGWILAVMLVLPRVAGTTGSPPAAPRDELVRQSKNPVADFFRIQLMNNTGFGIGPYDRIRNAFNCQFLIPIRLTETLRLIPRPLAGVVYQPDAAKAQGGAFGLGDFRATVYLATIAVRNLIWGAGPTIVFPTATSKKLGTGKWLIGPNAAAVYIVPQSWSFSLEIAQLWSFAGAAGRRNINSFIARPSAGYAFLSAKGLYVFTSPVFEADWAADADNRWIVPVGGGAGFPFKSHTIALDASSQIYWVAVSPKGLPGWVLQFRLQAAFM